MKPSVLILLAVVVLLAPGSLLASDTDGDGMPDDWEVANGFDLNDPTDATLDADEDWLLNVEECGFASNPHDAESPAFVYVDDDATGNPVQDGTLANPYESIQVAIGAATPPAVVKVLPGTYYEALVIPDGVWVIGPGVASATINAGDTAHAVEFVDAGDGLLAGFAVMAGGTTYQGLKTTGLSSPTVRDCTFTGSRSGMGLGGDGTPRIVSCLIAGNPYQGIFTGDTAAPTIINCTIADNGANGVVKWGSGHITITNSILYGNADDINGTIPSFTVTCCDIGDGDYAGTSGNISLDPVFFSQFAGDYRLLPSSPCIDAATSDGAPSLDVHGEARWDNPDTSNTGGGALPWYDMGAYERAPGTIYVDDDAGGDPGPGDPTVSDPSENGTPDHPFDAIQEGIDAAVSGDTVLVLDGTYTGTGNRDIEFLGKAITVQSQNGAATTIIDCQQLGRGFYFQDSETSTSVLDGFTIQNGYADGPTWPKYNGGGILFDQCSPTVTNCVLRDNQAYETYYEGGALYCYYASPTITGCTITGNTGYGAIALGNDNTSTITNCTISGNDSEGLLIYENGSPTLTGCDISNNERTGIDCYLSDLEVVDCTISGNLGGGIYYGGGLGNTLTMTGCRVTGNLLQWGGGGLEYHAWASSASATIEDCTFQENCATDGSAGGIYCYSAGSLTLTDCTIRGNWAQRSGGAYCYAASLTVTGCTIEDNSSGGGSAGIDCYSDTSVTVTDCVIRGNSTAGNGGGIYCDSPAIEIADCVVEGNSSGSSGGGIFCYGSHASFSNVLVAGNTARWGGGGIDLLYFDSATIESCTFVNNRATEAWSYGGGLRCIETDATLLNTLLWGNEAYRGHEIAVDWWSVVPTVTATYCDIEGGASEVYVRSGGVFNFDGTNITADPLVRPDGHLRAGSPCIDYCPTGPATDIDGEARPYPGGGSYDIGADEFIDTDGDGLPDWWEEDEYGSPTGADPTADTDMDDLNSLGEYNNNTDPHDPDSDGDGYTDGHEVAAGTDPLDPTEFPQGVRGTVESANESAPLADVAIDAIDPGTGSVIASSTTEPDGSYHISIATPGDYRIKARASDYADRYYDDREYADQADLVTVVADTITTGIDFGLYPGSSPGGIRVVSSPAGAEIVLDSIATGYVTPYTITDLATLSPDYVGVRDTPYSFASRSYNFSSRAYRVSVRAAGQPRVSARSVMPAECEIVEVAFDFTSTITGTLTVESVPVSGADIFIDAQPTGEVTPYTFTDLEVGSHCIAVRRSGYEPAPQTVHVGADTFMALDLGYDTGTLKVMSNPSGAEVYLDGEYTAHVTPYTLEDVAAGSHTIRLKKAGLCTTPALDVPVSPGQITEASLCLGLEKPGTISGTITNTTPSPSLWVRVSAYDSNGISSPKAGVAENGQYKIMLPAGTYTVRTWSWAHADEFYDDVNNQDDATPVTVTVQADTPGIDFELVEGESPGRIRVTSSSGGAEIYLDTSTTGQLTPYTLTDVPVGSHTVVVHKAGFPWLAPQTTSVRECMTTEVYFAFDVLTGAISVFSTPDGAAIYLDDCQTAYLTPYTLSDVAVGSHSVRVVKQYYAPCAPVLVTVDENVTVFVDFLLAFGDDTDEDGLPDDYEIYFFGDLSHTADGDDDMYHGVPTPDGLTNAQELLAGTDPTNPDSDGDGLLDGVETNTGQYENPNDTGTDPLNPDTDNDGLTDWEEVCVYASDPNKPDDITDVYWDQAGQAVVLVFASEEGVGYVLEAADADQYDDGLSWYAMATGPITGTGPQDLVVDDLVANPLTHALRLYRVTRADASNTSRQTAAVFELSLPVGFAVREFRIAVPLVLDPDHASVQAVLSTQIDWPGASVTRLDADTGLYSRMGYNEVSDTWSVLAGSPFDFAFGEGYTLNVGNAIPVPIPLRFAGYIPETGQSVPVYRASFAVEYRWMCYPMPRPTTLGALGLEVATTPFWDPNSMVQILPIGSTLWSQYKYNGTNWYDVATMANADATLIPCGQGFVFVNRGIPGTPDMLALPKWYVHPPNLW